MEGIIVNYRGGRHTQYDKQMAISVSSVDNKDKAAKLVGKKVTWSNTKGNAIIGKIAAIHGNSGAVRAIF